MTSRPPQRYGHVSRLDTSGGQQWTEREREISVCVLYVDNAKPWQDSQLVSNHQRAKSIYIIHISSYLEPVQCCDLKHSHVRMTKHQLPVVAFWRHLVVRLGISGREVIGPKGSALPPMRLFTNKPLFISLKCSLVVSTIVVLLNALD